MTYHIISFLRHSVYVCRLYQYLIIHNRWCEGKRRQVPVGMGGGGSLWTNQEEILLWGGRGNWWIMNKQESFLSHFTRIKHRRHRKRASVQKSKDYKILMLMLFGEITFVIGPDCIFVNLWGTCELVSLTYSAAMHDFCCCALPWRFVAVLHPKKAAGMSNFPPIFFPLCSPFICHLSAKASFHPKYFFGHKRCFCLLSLPCSLGTSRYVSLHSKENF